MDVTLRAMSAVLVPYKPAQDCFPGESLELEAAETINFSLS
jgi:hypothetical protein